MVQIIGNKIQSDNSTDTVMYIGVEGEACRHCQGNPCGHGQKYIYYEYMEKIVLKKGQ